MNRARIWIVSICGIAILAIVAVSKGTFISVLPLLLLVAVVGGMLLVVIGEAPKEVAAHPTAPPLRHPSYGKLPAGSSLAELAEKFDREHSLSYATEMLLEARQASYTRGSSTQRNPVSVRVPKTAMNELEATLKVLSQQQSNAAPFAESTNKPRQRPTPSAAAVPFDKREGHKLLNLYSEWKQQPLKCVCGWNGRVGESTFSRYEEEVRYDCPDCHVRLATVLLPSDEEIRRYGTDEDRRAVDEIAKRNRDLAKRGLKHPDQLPDIAENGFVLMWDVDRTGEHYDTVIRLGSQVLWREPEFYEGGWRFAEVADILRAKYGGRVKDLIPMGQTIDYLDGDDKSSWEHVVAARHRLAGENGIIVDSLCKRFPLIEDVGVEHRVLAAFRQIRAAGELQHINNGFPSLVLGAAYDEKLAGTICFFDDTNGPNVVCGKKRWEQFENCYLPEPRCVNLSDEYEGELLNALVNIAEGRYNNCPEKIAEFVQATGMTVNLWEDERIVIPDNVWECSEALQRVDDEVLGALLAGKIERSQAPDMVGLGAEEQKARLRAMLEKPCPVAEPESPRLPEVEPEPQPTRKPPRDSNGALEWIIIKDYSFSPEDAHKSGIESLAGKRTHDADKVALPVEFRIFADKDTLICIGRAASEDAARLGAFEYVKSLTGATQLRTRRWKRIPVDAPQPESPSHSGRLLTFPKKTDWIN